MRSILLCSGLIVMNHTLLAILGITCIIAVAFAGCTGTAPSGEQTPTATGTTGPAATTPATGSTAATAKGLVVGNSSNGHLIFMKVGGMLTLKLAENPTTGYAWNLTTSNGLKVVSDTYVPSDTTGTLVGSGGTHVWEIQADQAGMQSIDAVYKRSWEPLAGNESTYTLAIDVT
ncbi:MAG TPA: protease inhibitor I42 family protein [Methanoregulaceae archaeon]|nr:protease inhibitor I42 family protein [Methanoregulaceae archaeon]